MKHENFPVEVSAEPTVSTLNNESGRIGYFIAWLLGVPASVLFLIFLVRGH